MTPTLNASAFLGTTIESVLTQTYGKIQYLVVDGGSSDSTLEIVRQYGPRVALYRLNGSSQAEAINYGFTQARGEFFTFLNADDTLAPEAVERGVGALRENTDAAYSYAQGMHVDQERVPVRPYPSTLVSRESLLRECAVCQPTALLRSAAFAEIGGLEESYETAFDYDLWIRLTNAGYTGVFLDHISANVMMHANSKTIRERPTVFREVFKMLRGHYGYVPFTWVHAYAGYRIDRNDGFFQPPMGSPLRTALTLAVGLRENGVRGALRFIQEFTAETLRLHQLAKSARQP